MDQFDRGPRMRLNEENARGQLARAEREREQARLIGDVEDDPSLRRLLLGVAVVLLVAVMVVVFYPAITQPRADRPAVADEPAWGTTTDQTTLVQPPAWWQTPSPTGD